MGPGSVRVDDEARESAILVGVPSVHLPAVQLDEDFIAHIQVQDDAVAGVVVVLVCVLGNGAGPDLSRENRTTLSRPVRSWADERGPAEEVQLGLERRRKGSGLQGAGEDKERPGGTAITSCATPASFTPSLILNLNHKVGGNNRAYLLRLLGLNELL